MVRNSQELCKPAFFYPEELKVISTEASEGELLAYEAIKKTSPAQQEHIDDSVGTEYLETETPDWRISPEQYQRLIHYVGCGNFPEADILFFGNEEGTGTFSIEANVEARCSTFGKEPGSSSYTYTFGDLETDGFFWEPAALGGRDKIVDYLRAKGGKPKVSDTVRGSFLPSISRIVLALENQANTPIESWFETDHSKETERKIKEFALQGLFCPREGIQTALTDWRHLPRPNEGAWYDEYRVTETIEKCYLSAYNQFASAKKDSFSDYSEDAEKRKRILLNAFVKSPAKVLIGLGGANGFKKEVLSRLFGLSFEPVDLAHGISMNRAVAHLGSKEMSIFLLPFPSAQVYGSKGELLDCLKTFVIEHLAPLMDKQHRQN
ncbi:hypothetical protein [Paenibacillus ginsengarvi]|nr:hypothetical protein [Paenibacillus ginsengarvi]